MSRCQKTQLEILVWTDEVILGENPFVISEDIVTDWDTQRNSRTLEES